MLNGVHKRLLFKRHGEVEEQQNIQDEISILDPNLPIQNAIEYLNKLNEVEKLEITKLFESQQHETGILFNRLWDAGIHLSPAEFLNNYSFQIHHDMVNQFENSELITHEILVILHNTVIHPYSPDAIKALLQKPTNLFEMLESNYVGFNINDVITMIDMLKEYEWDDETIIWQLREGLDNSILTGVLKILKNKDKDIYIRYAFELEMIDMTDPVIVEYLIFNTGKTYAEIGNIIRDSSREELSIIFDVLDNKPVETGKLINSFYEANMSDLHPIVLVKKGLTLSKEMIEQWDQSLIVDYILQMALAEMDRLITEPIYEHMIDQLDNPIADAINFEKLQGRDGIGYAPVMIHILDEMDYSVENIARFLSNLRQSDKFNVPDILVAFADWYSNTDLAIKVLETMNYQDEFIKELFDIVPIEERTLTRLKKSSRRNHRVVSF